MALTRYAVNDFSTVEELRRHYNNKADGELLFVYSGAELGFLSRYSPLTVLDINQSMNADYFVERGNIPNQAASLCAFLLTSMDNSIFNGVMNPDMVKSKKRHLNKILGVLDAKAVAEECKKENVLSETYSIKSRALDVGRQFEHNFDKYRLLSKQSGDEKIIGFLKEIFGDNLDHVFQYGSSIGGGGEDVDLIVFLKDFCEPVYRQIYGRGSGQHFAKPISLSAILPADYLEAFCALEPDNYGILTGDGGRLIYGDGIDFPVLDKDETIEKMLIKAGKNLTSLRGSLTDEKRMSAMVSQRKLLKSTLKDRRFINKALANKEHGRILSRNEHRALRPELYDGVPMVGSIDAVKDLLFRANASAEQDLRHVYYRYLC